MFVTFRELSLLNTSVSRLRQKVVPFCVGCRLAISLMLSLFSLSLSPSSPPQSLQQSIFNNTPLTERQRWQGRKGEGQRSQGSCTCPQQFVILNFDLNRRNYSSIGVSAITKIKKIGDKLINDKTSSLSRLQVKSVLQAKQVRDHPFNLNN